MTKAKTYFWRKKSLNFAIWCHHLAVDAANFLKQCLSHVPQQQWNSWLLPSQRNTKHRHDKQENQAENGSSETENIEFSYSVTALEKNLRKIPCVAEVSTISLSARYSSYFKILQSRHLSFF